MQHGRVRWPGVGQLTAFLLVGVKHSAPMPCSSRIYSGQCRITRPASEPFGNNLYIQKYFTEQKGVRTWNRWASSMERRARAKTRARRPGSSVRAGLMRAHTNAQKTAAEDRRRRRPIAAIAGTPRISSRYLIRRVVGTTSTSCSSNCIPSTRYRMQ